MKTEPRHCMQNRMAAWSFLSSKVYDDPFNDVELSAAFEDPDGREMVVPAHWAGGHRWGLRFASPKLGRHRFRTICSDSSNPDLHDRGGLLEVIPYRGDDPLFAHGPLRVSQESDTWSTSTARRSCGSAIQDWVLVLEAV